MPISIAPHESPNLLGSESPLEFDHAGWLHGAGVVLMPAHPSWFYSELKTPESEPLGCVWHYTATKYGTAKSMAKRRTRKRKPEQRAASWHFTVAGDGRIWQLVSAESGSWHCRGKVGKYSVNRSLVGIELEGYGKEFPKPQVWAATRLVRALVQDYCCERRHLEHGHVDFDPKRRSDPGKLWSETILPDILDSVFKN